MNVEVGTEAAKFPEKEYINGIFVAVQYLSGTAEPLVSEEAFANLTFIGFSLRKLLTVMEMSEKCNLYRILSFVWNGYHTVTVFVSISAKFSICMLSWV
jgi:hypothetical protein